MVKNKSTTAKKVKTFDGQFIKINDKYYTLISITPLINVKPLVELKIEATINE